MRHIYKLREALAQFSLAVMQVGRDALTQFSFGLSCHSASLLVDATHQLLIPLSTEV